MLKSIARAISPFTSSKGKPTDSDSANEHTFDQFNWDLTRVDMVAMLKNFYTIYNPDRVKSVSEILHQYEGEEVLMLQQLCERYNLTEGDIQEFMDNAVLGRKDKFGNWIRKKSEGSVTFSDADNSSSINGKKDASKVEYSSFFWDLSDVDLAKALKLLYRKHNPQKTPNIASLENKSEKDRMVLLQQLCKRHTLSKADMQSILDKAKTTASRVPSVSKTGSGRSVGGGSSIGSGQSSQATSLLSTLQRQNSSSGTGAAAAEEQAKSEGGDAGVIRGDGNQQQRTGSLPFWQNRFPSPFSSPPPPPPPPPGAPAAPPSPNSQMLGGLFGGMGSGQRSSPASVAGSVNSSVTAGTGVGTSTGTGAGRVGGSGGGGSNTGTGRFSSSPAPSVVSAGSGGTSSKGRRGNSQSVGTRGNREKAKYAADSGGTESALESGVESDDLKSEAASKSRNRSRGQQGPGSVGGQSAATAGTGVAAGGKVRAEELMRLQQELSEARLQLTGLAKENRALIKALHESKQRQSDAESTVSGLSSQAAGQEHVPELLLEISNLNNTLKQQEDREQALRRQFGQAKQQIVTLQEQCAEQERMCAAARADCKDVLRLVDIMSASPAGIKNVLEAYLKKLGEATGSVPVKFGMGPDGRQLAISERISIALKIKREQDQLLAAQTGEGNSDAPEVAGSGAGAGAVGNRLRAESARSAGSSSIAGAGASTSTSKRGAPGGKALERQQEAYQAFKNKLSTRVGQASSAPSNDTSSHPTEGDGEEVEKEEGEEAGEDFAEYASPQKQQQEDRKTASSSSAGLSSRRSAENKSEEKPGQMQASLASEIATDWVECLDPRSKRKYYYSAALKKSTWVKPGNFAPPSSATKATAAASVLSSMTVTMPSRYASPNVSMNYSGRGSPGYAQEQAAQSSSGGGGRMTAGELQSEEGVGHNTTAAHARALLMTSPTTSTSNSHSSTGGGGGHSSAGRRQAGGGDDLQQQQSPMRSASPFSTVSLTSATSAASADFSAVFTTKSKGITGTYLTSTSSNSGAGTGASGRPNSSNSPASSSRGGSSPATSIRGGATTASASGDWVTAVDPKSNRKYWYNRNTKVSTWRQPAELIV